MGLRVQRSIGLKQKSRRFRIWLAGSSAEPKAKRTKEVTIIISSEATVERSAQETLKSRNPIMAPSRVTKVLQLLCKRRCAPEGTTFTAGRALRTNGEHFVIKLRGHSVAGILSPLAGHDERRTPTEGKKNRGTRYRVKILCGDDSAHRII